MVGGPLGVDCFSEAGFNCMVPTCSCRSKCRKKCRKKTVRNFFPPHSVRVWPGRQGGKGPGKKGPAREEMIRIDDERGTMGDVRRQFDMMKVMRGGLRALLFLLE